MKTVYCHGIVLATPVKENQDGPPNTQNIEQEVSITPAVNLVTAETITNTERPVPIRPSSSQDPDMDDRLMGFTFLPNNQTKSKLLNGGSSISGMISMITILMSMIFG